MKQLILILITLLSTISANDTIIQDAKTLYQQNDYFEAFRLFETACNEGSGAECSYVGGMYEKGNGVKTDMKKARIYYTKACDDNDIFSCNALALFYQDGIAVKKDLHKAKELYKKICDNGNAMACAYYNGLETKGKQYLVH